MRRSLDLLRLVPDATEPLLDILDGARGAVEPPNRSEIFGPERFAQHGRSLGDTHRAQLTRGHAGAFFPRLADNIRNLREAQQYIGAQARTGYQVSPAAEWLLDNFHLIEAQLKEIHEGLPRRYFRNLPVLIDEPLAGLPRIYGVAWAFVAHTDGAFDEDLLSHFLGAYQQTRELTLGELWALPTTLRVVLVENLRRLAERIVVGRAARQEADALADRLDRITGESSGSPAEQLAAWVEMMFDLAYDPQLRMHLTVIDSDEVRAAKGYRETRERLHAARERSLARVLARGRDDGSFPLTDPARDAVAISAVVSRELTISAPGDAAELQRARARVLDFALRALGARRLPG